MQFTLQQDRALCAASRWLRAPGAQVFRLFGYAGTGKTTLAKHLAEHIDDRVRFAAYTGKAAHVMRAKGCKDAGTLHSLIYTCTETQDGPQFELTSQSPLAEAALLIVDECSMVDATLGNDILSFGVSVLVLGDPEQLPPVHGAGFFTSAAPDVLLTDIQRASVPFMMTRELKSQLEARGYSAAEIANLTPQEAHDILREVARGAAATAQGGLAEEKSVGVHAGEKPVGVHAGEKPAPSDPLACWRASGARLEPSREPCARYRPGEWPRVHRVIAAFLAGPFAKLAVDAGWTELELVGVHPEVTNAYGSPVTQVTPQLIRFANGLAVYKARLSAGNSVAVWDYREPAVGERQQLARTPISESVTDSAEGEPGLEQPCAARRGRVQEKDGVFLHFCVECGRFGPYGYGVRLRAGQLGRWYCREHRPQGHEP